jgi:hypothetical protein
MANYETLADWKTPRNPSSQIDAIAHDGNRLLMRFKSFSDNKPMAVYEYPDATPEHMDELLKADSPGSAFNAWKKTEHGLNFNRLPPEPEAAK